MADLRNQIVIAIVGLTVLCCVGCKPGEMNALKAQLDGMEVKIAEDVTATVDAKMDAKIKILSSEMQQEVGLLLGSQNLGMFAGGGIYVLILALVVVLAVIGGIVFLIWVLLRQKAKAKAKDLLANTLVSAIASARRKNGADQIQAVLAEVKDQANKAGIKQELDRLLIERSAMD